MGTLWITKNEFFSKISFFSIPQATPVIQLVIYKLVLGYDSSASSSNTEPVRSTGHKVK